jgi:hypothetical protein
MIVNRILDIVSRRLAHFLSAPIKGYRPIVTPDVLPKSYVQGTSECSAGFQTAKPISIHTLHWTEILAHVGQPSDGADGISFADEVDNAGALGRFMTSNVMACYLIHFVPNFMILFFILTAAFTRALLERRQSLVRAFSGFGGPVNWIAADILRIKDGMIAARSIDTLGDAGLTGILFRESTSFSRKLFYTAGTTRKTSSSKEPLDSVRAEFIKYILSKDDQTLTERGGYFPIANEIREHDLEVLGISILANEPFKLCRGLFVRAAFGKICVDQLGKGRLAPIDPAVGRGSAPLSTRPRSRFASPRAASGVQGEPCLPIVTLRSTALRPAPAR